MINKLRINRRPDYVERGGFAWDNSEIVFGDPFTHRERVDDAKKRAAERFKEKHKDKKNSGINRTMALKHGSV